MKIELERKLTKHMSHQDIDFDPADCSINPDGKRYSYEISVNGEIKEAWYIAFYGEDNSKKRFMCTYGLVDDSKQYTYVSDCKEE